MYGARAELVVRDNPQLFLPIFVLKYDRAEAIGLCGDVNVCCCCFDRHDAVVGRPMTTCYISEDS